MGQGHTAQYVAGTMPVAVPHRPDSADVRKEHLIRKVVAAVQIQGHEATMRIHPLNGQHDADDVQAMPDGLRFIIPVQFDQNGLADVADSACGIQGQASASHGHSPPRQRRPFRSADQPAGG